MRRRRCVSAWATRNSTTRAAPSSPTTADFTLINCYFPNGGRDHSRVPYKLAFYDAFLALCERLRAEGRPVIFCGDVNTAHREIDLARPRENRNTTGFLPEERAWMDRLVASGYVDTLRHFHPDLAGQYTWWLQFGGARERNIGWRIDYFFVAAEVLPRVAGALHPAGSARQRPLPRRPALGCAGTGAVE